ncbi:HI1506-related protein [Metapseudomonas otitidis]|uniref:HI1506-related protein n=1 Tax=Metapseudomonas otitidis TaxID=319939 RepID=UPI0013F5AEFA|nr:HI1506-related protein [Pseudomonas otitidis]
MAGKSNRAANTATKPTPAETTVQNAEQGQDVLVVDTVPGIFVRSFGESFRRAGFVFTREGHGLLVDDLTEAQLKALVNEPMLNVQYCDFPATEEADKALADRAKDSASDTAPAGTEPPQGGNA